MQGVDWRDARTSACNGNRNPIQQDFYDGINADPLEVLFIKVKSSMRQAGWGHVTKARAFPPLTLITAIPRHLCAVARLSTLMLVRSKRATAPMPSYDAALSLPNLQYL